MDKTIKRLRDKYQYFKGLECADDVLSLCAEYEKLHNDHHNLLRKIAEKIKRAEGAAKKAELARSYYKYFSRVFCQCCG